MKCLVVALLLVAPALAQAAPLSPSDVKMLIQPSETYRGSIILPIMEWQINEYNLIMDAQQQLLEEQIKRDKADIAKTNAYLHDMAYAALVAFFLVAILTWFVTYSWMRKPK